MQTKGAVRDKHHDAERIGSCSLSILNAVVRRCFAPPIATIDKNRLSKAPKLKNTYI